jgi:pimeloyl-ACP methyl ester carboxylesterase
LPAKHPIDWFTSTPENQLEIVLPHIRLAARRWGAEDKPLLLALHGWLDNANSFAPIAEHLDDFQILAIDWPGHGFSAHRPGQYPLHWIDYLFDLEVLLAHLKPLKPAALIGHSLGGIVASAYAAAFYEKVPRLVLIEALVPLFEDVALSKQRLIRSFASHMHQWRKMATPSVYDSIETAVQARARLTGMDEALCRLLVGRNMRACEGGVCWRSDPRLKLDSPMRLCLEQVDALMQGCTTPSLLILGDRGFPQLQQHLGKARLWYANLSVLRLTGDHHLHMGNAAAVADAIRHFLQPA